APGLAAPPSSPRQYADTCRMPRSARARDGSPCFRTSAATRPAWSTSIRADFAPAGTPCADGPGLSPPAVLQPVAAASDAAKAAANPRGRERMGRLLAPIVAARSAGRARNAPCAVLFRAHGVAAP